MTGRLGFVSSGWGCRRRGPRADNRGRSQSGHLNCVEFWTLTSGGVLQWRGYFVQNIWYIFTRYCSHTIVCCKWTIERPEWDAWSTENKNYTAANVVDTKIISLHICENYFTIQCLPIKMEIRRPRRLYIYNQPSDFSCIVVTVPYLLVPERYNISSESVRVRLNVNKRFSSTTR